MCMCGLDAHTDIYATVGPAVMICQLLSVLEIIHPLLRWVRTGVMMPILQVGHSIHRAKSENLYSTQSSNDL